MKPLYSIAVVSSSQINWILWVKEYNFRWNLQGTSSKIPYYKFSKTKFIHKNFEYRYVSPRFTNIRGWRYDGIIITDDMKSHKDVQKIVDEVRICFIR